MALEFLQHRLRETIRKKQKKKVSQQRKTLTAKSFLSWLIQSLPWWATFTCHIVLPRRSIRMRCLEGQHQRRLPLSVCLWTRNDSDKKRRMSAPDCNQHHERYFFDVHRVRAEVKQNHRQETEWHERLLLWFMGARTVEFVIARIRNALLLSLATSSHARGMLMYMYTYVAPSNLTQSARASARKPNLKSPGKCITACTDEADRTRLVDLPDPSWRRFWQFCCLDTPPPPLLPRPIRERPSQLSRRGRRIFAPKLFPSLLFRRWQLWRLLLFVPFSMKMWNVYINWRSHETRVFF